MSPQFQISGNELGSKSSPDVGGDPSATGPSYYCVVWENRWNDDGDIHARRVSTASQPFGNTFAIDSTFGDDSRPRISKSCGMPPRANQRWTLVWTRYQSTLNYDIYGAQVSWDGQITAPTFQIDTTASNDRNPTVSTILDGASGDRPYLVAWFDGADISGRILRGSAALTPRTNLTALEGGANQGYAQLTPCAESDGSTFVLAYAESRPGTSYDIYVAEYDFGGAQIVCTDPNRLVASHSESEINPYMTSRRSAGGQGADFMAVWNRVLGAGDTLVQGALLYSTGFGHTYCSSTPNSSGAIGRVRMTGSRSVANQNMALWAELCPPNKPGLFFLGSAQVDLPFGDGRRCVGGAVKRMGFTATNGAGFAFRQLDFAAPYASGIAGGVNYQYWFRDPAGGPADYNLTGGLHVEHTP